MLGTRVRVVCFVARSYIRMTDSVDCFMLAQTFNCFQQQRGSRPHGMRGENPTIYECESDDDVRWWESRYRRRWLFVLFEGNVSKRVMCLKYIHRVRSISHLMMMLLPHHISFYSITFHWVFCNNWQRVPVGVGATRFDDMLSNRFIKFHFR